MILYLFAGTLLVLISICSAKADIMVPAIFSDNMVLKQQSQVLVWGWANPNTTVKVVGSWEKKVYKINSDNEGSWKIRIKTPRAGYTPYTLTISDGKEIVIKNILIGEVWVCSGQSNMQMPVQGFPFGEGQPVKGGPEAIVNSANKGIRCFTVQPSSKLLPQSNCEGKWEIASLETVPNFTATGYFFGRMLNQILDIPIGLIHTSWGGSCIEAWMTPESLHDIPGKLIPTTNDDIKSLNHTPTLLYNGMIHPIVGFGISGVIWYQGESNIDEPDLYVKMFDSMVQGWRKDWEFGDFPVYYCQIAPYNYGGGKNSAYFREAQFKCMNTTSNTGMVVLMDSNSPELIHPPKKKEAGERLARWALANKYGMSRISYRSPEFNTLNAEGRVLIVSFNFVGGGLTSYDVEIKNFSIAGKDRNFYPAKAAIFFDKVYLFSPFVTEPIAVRYCFDNTSKSEIFTLDGHLPMSSFRSDNW